MNFSRFSISQLHWIFTALALLFAAWINYIQHGWINNDSTLYFEAARLFSLGAWQEGLKIYSWPLFSLLIAAIHKFTGLEIQPSAQVLNTLLFGLVTASFLQLIREAGGQKTTMVTGGLLLFSSQYIVGDILPMLLRDQGFWAFFLTSLVFFVRYAKYHKLKNALLWQLCIMIAALFRVEGVIYLVLLPLALLFTAPAGAKLKSFLQAHSLNILASIAFLMVILSFGLKSTELGRLQEIFTLDLYQQITQKLFYQADIMAQNVLGEYLDEFAISGLLITFIFIMIVKVFTTTGTINTILSLCALITRQTLIAQPAKTVLNTAILISLINMFLTITKVFVLSGRYVVGLALILMIYAALYLAYLIERYQAGYPRNLLKHSLLWIIFVSILIGLLANLWPKPTGFNYEQEAIHWLSKHHIDSQDVLFDSARLRYYAGLSYNNNLLREGIVLDSIEKKQLITEQYVVLIVNGKHDKKQVLFEESHPDYEEAIRFYGPRNKKSTLIYKLNKHHK